MARKRKQKKSWLENLSGFSIISLLINPVTLMVFVSLIAVVLWNKYHDRLDLPANQTINASMLHLNRPPAWIKTDISRIAIEESRLSEIPINHTDAVERVTASFAVQPWVKRVKNVSKTTTGIHIELQYRNPSVIVEVNSNQLIPVDTEGIVLDGRDFSNADVFNYLRISLPRPLTNGLITGRRWDDMRVTDCVLIANLFGSDSDKHGLFRIVNRSQPTRDRLRLKPYELWTRGGTIIVWGNPPGYEVRNEASAQEKLLAIRKFVEEHGPLDSPTRRYFDVQQGVVKPSASKLAREATDFVNQTY